ncbi:hypothetical protein NEAUS04_0530 [Nematocida ausubeli]|uniref:Uncharacterized protein n=1 Tax=Nematocida ausubeli (strain ATCC PRA-371 / ERTm2) TaxID=1913371 RepID=A0A086IZ44_NEMA1|nr:uncharacterized protein NESG_02382 [Nematocida ausubeli]KAI5133683.1 hypothetical protein NEAUS06_0695 [Nematocida ausubeli]KAI5134171.1 hypothetical protein NEAUS07_0745 [Nematocida ausubeli]KAI5147355.1 hypothetical protein NEAUS05_0666 [Nematocida ausubeli]KAI5161440.1 hypothetical protein NEAUS04_0530 [Nematocida ausubeli]KFG25162.1 hypothetical protein NESG_02382 [Nematocida ausubeli]
MAKYQVAKRVVVGVSVVGLFLKTYAASRMAMPAISGPMSQMCSSQFMKGTNVLGSMGINGMGGIGNAFQVGMPSICLREGKDDPNQVKMHPLVKKLTRMKAVDSLLNLDDTNCTIGKVSSKSQICHLFKLIKRKTNTPEKAVSIIANTVSLEDTKGVSAMFLYEPFGILDKKKKKKRTIAEIIGPANSNTTLNEFDDILKRNGGRAARKRSKCEECLKSLKNDLATTDLECDPCGETINIPFGMMAGAA